MLQLKYRYAASPGKRISLGWRNRRSGAYRVQRAGCTLTVFLGLLGGCRNDGQQGERRVAPGLWKPGQEWRVVEEATIGEAEDGSDGFSNVVDVELDPLGRVWVADAGAYQIRVFDPTGAPVRTIGRRGGAPAEFRAVGGLTLAPDGRMWVMDSGNARFAVYDTAGRLVETRPRESNMATSPWPGMFDRNGRLYDVIGDLAPDASILTSVVRTGAPNESPDTFPLPPFKAEQFEISRGDARNRSVHQVNVPFTGSRMWAIDPAGGTWIANTAKYRLERHGFDGRIERVVERKVQPVPVTAAQRRQILEGYEGFKRSGGVIDASRIPDHHPELRSFLLDDVGRLWVIPSVQLREGQVADVFDPTGAFLGRVTIPIPYRSRPVAIRDDRMVVVARDSLDLQSVILLRIERP